MAAKMEESTGDQHTTADSSDNKNPKLYAFLYTIKEWIANWRMPCGGQLMRHWMDKADAKLDNPKSQRFIVLIVVCIALLLDNMLYMVIVPIIPTYLRTIENRSMYENISTSTMMTSTTSTITDTTTTPIQDISTVVLSSTTLTTTTTESNNTILRSSKMLAHAYKNEDINIGVLFASKAIFQLLVNPFTGTLMDRIGYDIPMMIGLTIIFFSTMMFAIGASYGALFVARSLQGVGSAFADTSGLAMIADRYKNDAERSAALGIALAFISFGSLVAPPFGGTLYEFAGKAVPFILLALLALFDGCLMLFSMKPVRRARKELKKDHKLPKGTPIYKLIVDPYIAVCAGCLVMANVSLAFIEPTIAIWMKDTMGALDWQIGFIWLPAFIPHILGVFLTVKLAERYPSKQWLMAALGLALEGCSCLMIPFCKLYGVVIIPLCLLCFGIALVDTAILPLMGHLVDVRHVSVYGSVYAIADISYSLAYAFGPILAGQLIYTIGFKALNIIIFVTNVAYAPLLFALRKVYDYHKFEPSEEDGFSHNGTPNHKMYQTYTADSEDQHIIVAELSEVEIITTKPRHSDSELSDEETSTERTALRGSTGGLAGECRPKPFSALGERPTPEPRARYSNPNEHETSDESEESSEESETQTDADYY